ncbi:MAG: GNAT family N-acetyltransferase [Gammaproteobacteria bacterium]|jgi:predicted acetyltransferase|nr:GNAT family N-acetyltransferase [Gammaproteobacteria bacterium]
MMADYSKDKALFEKCITFIDEIFPGCKEMALRGINYGASWKECSTPFIIEHQGEVIAHAGVWPFTVILNGEKHKTASIHGVCVRETHRGKGYFKQLMREAIDYAEKTFQSSLLFTDKPYLYQNYPYKVMLPEYDFILNKRNQFSTKDSDLRALNLENSDDLALLHQLLTSRLPLSNLFGFYGKSANTLFILNSLRRKIFYSKKLNVMIVYEINHDTLYMKEIVVQTKIPLTEILEMIPDTFTKVVFEFCPDQFLSEKEYAAVLAKPECAVLVSNRFNFNKTCFRYPEIYSC